MTFGKTVLAIIVALILTPIVGSILCGGCVAFVNKTTRENQERMERKP